MEKFNILELFGKLFTDTNVLNGILNGVNKNLKPNGNDSKVNEKNVLSVPKITQTYKGVLVEEFIKKHDALSKMIDENSKPDLTKSRFHGFNKKNK